MAISNLAVWEMRAGSSDQNGGGFVPGATGTDWSQQASPQYSVVDAVTNTTTTVTSATANFGTDVVGNLCCLVEGGTPRWFEIISRTNATTIVLDRATNGTASGQTLKIGGAIGMTNSGFRFRPYAQPGNKVWQNGAFSITGSAPTWSQAGTATNPITFEGYGSVRGDGGRASITRTANNINCLDISVDFIIVKNLKLDQGVNFNTCLGITGNRCWIENCWFIASDTDGNGSFRVDLTGNNNTLHRCYIDCNNKGGQGVNITGTGNRIQHCTQTGSHEEVGIFVGAGPTTIEFCIIRNNALDGIQHGVANGLTLRHNDIWKNGRDGVRLTSAANGLGNISIQGNIFGRNTSYDIRYTPSDIAAQTGTVEWAAVEVKDNAFWSTGTGKSLNLPAFGNDTTLSANPFTDDTTTFDFSLNSTAGGGALVAATRRTIAFGDLVNTGYYALGALGAAAVTTPTAPSGLLAAEGSSGVVLTWLDNSSNEDNFVVERAIGAGLFSVLITLSSNTTTYTDTSALPDTQYSYKVKATNSAGSSAYSNTATLTTAPTGTGTPTPPDIDEVRFPPGISRGAIGGEMFATIVVAGSTGVEQRNENWDTDRMVWEVSHGLRTPEEGRELKAFFKCRKGKSRGFRFKNWDDYTSTNEVLYQTGAKTVQLAKTYSDGVFSSVKNIFKPTEDYTPFTMRRNGVNFTDFTLDETTGIVTLDADASFNISAITKAANAVITVTAHTYLTGETVYIEGVNGMTQINGQTVVIVSTGANTITVDLDTSAYSTYTSGGTAAEYVQPSEVLDWAGEFDIPARFDTDQLRLSLTDSFIREWNDIPVVELIA